MNATQRTATAMPEHETFRISKWHNPTNHEISIEVFESIVQSNGPQVDDPEYELSDIELIRRASNRRPDRRGTNGLKPNKTIYTWKSGETRDFPCYRPAINAGTNIDSAIWDVRDADGMQVHAWYFATRGAKIVGGQAPELRRLDCAHLQATSDILPASREELEARAIAEAKAIIARLEKPIGGKK
jgi:hypothetical protein